MIPPLFSRIPGPLFRPLTGGLAPLCWQILARFYEYEFEGEPVNLIKTSAVAIAEQLVRESDIWRERREEVLAGEDEDEPPSADETADEGALAHAAGQRLVGRLERAGWFHFEFRGGLGLVLSFHPYAARILETLVRVARDEQPVFQGYAHSIASLLRADTYATKPGLSIREAKRHTFELLRELKILNRNIFAFTQRLLDEVSTAAGVLEEGLDRYRHAVQANYHRLKTVDNLFKWRGEILLRLDAIEADDVGRQAAARWYAEQDRVDSATATAAVAEDLRILRMQFETMPEITDDIDARNARFSGVALRKLMYLLRQDRRAEGQLQLIVDSLAHDRAPELVFDIYLCELLADGFLYTPPKQRARAEPRPLARPPKPDSATARRAMADLVRQRFSRKRIQEFVEGLLGGRPRASLSSAPFVDDEDYLRAIFAVAFGVDGDSRYVFSRDVDRARGQKGRYGFPEGAFERKRRR